MCAVPWAGASGDGGATRASLGCRFDVDCFAPVPAHVQDLDGLLRLFRDKVCGGDASPLPMGAVAITARHTLLLPRGPESKALSGRLAAPQPPSGPWAARRLVLWVFLPGARRLVLGLGASEDETAMFPRTLTNRLHLATQAVARVEAAASRRGASAPGGGQRGGPSALARARLHLAQRHGGGRGRRAR